MREGLKAAARGAILTEQNDEGAKPARGLRPGGGLEWQAESAQRSRHMTLESIGPIGDDPIVGLPNLAE